MGSSLGTYRRSPSTDKTSFDGSVELEGWHLRWGGCKLQGWRARQEDTMAVYHENFEAPDSEGGGRIYLAVFDGHGGSATSERCGRLFCRFVQRFLGREEWGHRITNESLRAAFLAFDAHLSESRAERGRHMGCGSTVALCIIDTRRELVHVANLGDSRMLVFWDRPEEIAVVTLDHVPLHPVERERILGCSRVVQGVPPDRRILMRGNRVFLGDYCSLNVCRGFGDHDFKRTPSLPPSEQAVSAVPAYHVVPYGLREQLRLGGHVSPEERAEARANIAENESLATADVPAVSRLLRAPSMARLDDSSGIALTPELQAEADAAAAAAAAAASATAAAAAASAAASSTSTSGPVHDSPAFRYSQSPLPPGSNPAAAVGADGGFDLDNFGGRSLCVFLASDGIWNAVFTGSYELEQLPSINEEVVRYCIKNVMGGSVNAVPASADPIAQMSPEAAREAEAARNSEHYSPALGAMLDNLVATYLPQPGKSSDNMTCVLATIRPKSWLVKASVEEARAAAAAAATAAANAAAAAAAAPSSPMLSVPAVVERRPSLSSVLPETNGQPDGAADLVVDADDTNASVAPPDDPPPPPPVDDAEVRAEADAAASGAEVVE